MTMAPDRTKHYTARPDPESEEGERIICHGYKEKRGFCGAFLGRFVQAQGFVKCPRCGHREVVNIAAAVIQ